MKIEFEMEVGTPKGKVSAIRKVVGLSSLSYLDRLELVRKILGEVTVVDSPPRVPDPFLPREGRVKVKPEALEARKEVLSQRIDGEAGNGLLYSQLGDCSNLRKALNVPMEARRRIWQVLFEHIECGRDYNQNKDLGYVAYALERWGWYPQESNKRIPFTSKLGEETTISSIEVAGALLYGVNKGDILIHIEKSKKSDKYQFSFYHRNCAKLPKDAVATIPSEIRSKQCIRYQEIEVWSNCDPYKIY